MKAALMCLCSMFGSSSALSSAELAQSLHPNNPVRITPLKAVTEEWRIQGDKVVVTKEEIEEFHRNGYLSLPPILTAEEMAGVRVVYDGFLNRTYSVPDKDYGDMSMPFDTPVEDYNMINVLLPRTYYPDMHVNSIYERRANSIVEQLFKDRPETLDIDFDQILAKLPNRNAASFAWHQDMGYWPDAPAGVSTATATISLALNEANVENGCLVLVQGSHREGLRPHVPLMKKENIAEVAQNEEANKESQGVDVADGHALQISLKPSDVVTHVPVAAGGITVHDEWIIHGSPGNHHKTDHRHTYILAFRDRDMISHERSMGFRHSHNDANQWDSFRKENVESGLQGQEGTTMGKADL